MPSPNFKGLGTAQWGSSGVFPVDGAIIESITFKPKNGAPIEIEDNEGFAKFLVYLPDGFNATVKCMYDSAKTWPKEADAITLTPNLPVGMEDDVPEDGYAGFVGSVSLDYARKKEEMIEIEIIYRPGVSTE